jgi:pSer/pThr/pTyr-binding forkhead associated (FHA) protein
VPGRDTNREAVSETPERRLPHFVIVEGYGTGRVFPVTKETTTIGRDPNGDIVLPYSTVSWHHAAIATSGNKLVVRDLGSRNGTFVGIDRVTHHELVGGDILAIGDSVVLKLVFVSASDGQEAARDLAAHDATAGVANAAALLDRLRVERSFTHYGDVALVLIFLGVDLGPAPDPQVGVEEIMREATAIARSALEGNDLLARSADRELVALLRGTTADAARAARKIQTAAEKPFKKRELAGGLPRLTVALVPIPARVALSAEAILLVASRKARDAMTVAMTVARNQIQTIALDNTGGRPTD